MGGKRLLVTAWLAVCFCGLGGLGGCLYDADDRCDDNQRYDEQRELCVCADDAISLPFGCVTCPAGTAVVQNQCVAP